MVDACREVGGGYSLMAGGRNSEREPASGSESYRPFGVLFHSEGMADSGIGEQVDVWRLFLIQQPTVKIWPVIA
jgi:hypothetical protein